MVLQQDFSGFLLYFERPFQSFRTTLKTLDAETLRSVLIKTGFRSQITAYSSWRVFINARPP